MEVFLVWWTARITHYTRELKRWRGGGEVVHKKIRKKTQTVWGSRHIISPSPYPASIHFINPFETLAIQSQPALL